jgi:hypothetical protein
VVDESLRVVSDGVVGKLVTDVLTKEESVTLKDTEDKLESVVDLAKGVVPRREDDDPVDNTVPVVEIDVEVKSVVGSVDVPTVVWPQRRFQQLALYCQQGHHLLFLAQLLSPNQQHFPVYLLYL